MAPIPLLIVFSGSQSPCKSITATIGSNQGSLVALFNTQTSCSSSSNVWWIALAASLGGVLLIVVIVVVAVTVNNKVKFFFRPHVKKGTTSMLEG